MARGFVPAVAGVQVPSVALQVTQAPAHALSQQTLSQEQAPLEQSVSAAQLAPLPSPGWSAPPSLPGMSSGAPPAPAAPPTPLAPPVLPRRNCALSPLHPATSAEVMRASRHSTEDRRSRMETGMVALGSAHSNPVAHFDHGSARLSTGAADRAPATDQLGTGTGRDAG